MFLTFAAVEPPYEKVPTTEKPNCPRPPFLTELHVPGDYLTINLALEAVKRYDAATNNLVVELEAVERNNPDDVQLIGKKITTIVLGRGEHAIPKNYTYLKIHSDMHIVGDPNVKKEDIVVIGGFQFGDKYQDRTQGRQHLQNLTIREANEHGVKGYCSFTMTDVLVENCGSGVFVLGNGNKGEVVVNCTNVEVRKCVGSGVSAKHKATVIFSGDPKKMKVHGNCTNRANDSYGVDAMESATSHQVVGGFFELIFPLDFSMSMDNGDRDLFSKFRAAEHNWGNFNWGNFADYSFKADKRIFEYGGGVQK